MKAGDKVFHIKKNKDVIVVDIAGSVINVYDDDTITYFSARRHDLLGYSVAERQKPVHRSIPCVSPQQTKTEKEGNKMFNVKSLLGSFGKVAPGECAITFGGQVVVRRNADEYVCYDSEKGQIVNHLNLVVKEASKFIYVLPVTAVEANDVIRVKNTYFQVLEQKEDGSIVGINLNTGAKSTQCKETNAFGINFYYKVTSLLGAQTAGATAGAFNPLMLMALSGEDSSSKLNDLLPLMLMGGAGATSGADFAQNPLLMMSLLGDGGLDKDSLLPLMLMGGGAFGAPVAGGTAPAFNPLMLLALGK